MPALNGRVAIITGASSGIGAAVAVHFAKLGATLSLTGRNEVNLKQTADDCIKNGASEDKILLAVGDITSEELRKQLVGDTVKKFGRIDILVNNAGMGIAGCCADGPLSKLDQMMDCNVRSLVHMSQLCLPHLEQVKGNIVNVSSVAGFRPNTSMGFYAMTKSAVDQFTRCLAYELGPKQVRVNSVNPAAVNTEFSNPNRDGKGFGDKKDAFRTGTADEVARAVAFLADNDESGWITGHLMVIDGGATLTNGSKHVMDNALKAAQGQ